MITPLFDALPKSLPLLEAVLAAIPLPAAVMTERGRILLTNAAWDAASRSLEPASWSRLPLVDAEGHRIALCVVERRRGGDTQRNAAEVVAFPSPTDPRHPRSALTPREREVAELIGEGMRNNEIARRLGLSPFTVRRHTERVLHKLQVESRAGVAARMAGVDRQVRLA